MKHRRPILGPGRQPTEQFAESERSLRYRLFNQFTLRAAHGCQPIAGEQSQIRQERPPKKLPLRHDMKRPANLLRMPTGDCEFPLYNGIGEPTERLDLNEPQLAAVHFHEEIGNNVGHLERRCGYRVVFKKCDLHSRRGFTPSVADSQRLFLNQSDIGTCCQDESRCSFQLSLAAN